MSLLLIKQLILYKMNFYHVIMTMQMNLPSVAVAECATCGTVSAEFGKVWGAAGYFKGSIITYDISNKVKYLNLPEKLVSDFVNRPKEVVEAMARGVCEMFGSKVGISTSGFATPYAPKGIKIPYIWYAVYNNETRQVVETGRIENAELLSRGAFQKKVGMMLHVKYMMLFGQTTADN
jgi:PncC family amidohydrolase